MSEDRDPLNAIQFQKKLAGANIELSATLTWAGSVLIDRDRDRPEIIAQEEDRLRRMMAVNLYGHLIPDVRDIRTRLIELGKKQLEFGVTPEFQKLMGAIGVLCDKLDGRE